MQQSNSMTRCYSTIFSPFVAHWGGLSCSRRYFQLSQRVVCPVAANYQDLNLSALGIPLRLPTLLNKVLAKDNQLLLKRCITVSGKCDHALNLSELRAFSPVTLNSVQSLQRYLFNFVGLVIAIGEEGFVAFLFVFSFTKSLYV